MMREYLVVYEWPGRNFSGYAPDIPGCIGTARTLAKMRATLRGALEAHLQWIQDDGDAIPEASAAVTVDMASDREFPNPPGYCVIVENLEVILPKKKRASNRKTAMRELTAA
jgi:predicted RNase H-like HicB family nuclease